MASIGNVRASSAARTEPHSQHFRCGQNTRPVRRLPVVEIWRWDAIPNRLLPTASKLRRTRWNSAIGLVLSAGLHSVVLLVAIGGLDAPLAAEHVVQGFGTAFSRSDSEGGLIFAMVPEVISAAAEIDGTHSLSADTEAQKYLKRLTSRAVSLSATITPPELPAIDMSSDEARTGDRSDSEALFFVRYTNQVQARVLRAWRRPRSSVVGIESELPPQAHSLVRATDSDGDTKDENAHRQTFHCDARIAQDSQGNVLEVSLQNCNGTYVWQQSLVSAIQSASPLPAPPVPSVFAYSLDLSFDSQEYRAGENEQVYEMAENAVSTVPLPRSAPITERARTEPLAPLLILAGVGSNDAAKSQTMQTTFAEPPAQQLEAEPSQ